MSGTVGRGDVRRWCELAVEAETRMGVGFVALRRDGERCVGRGGREDRILWMGWGRV